MIKILLFGVFNSFLPGGDVITDLITCIDLYYNNHVYWAVVSFLLMWNPFIIHLLLFFAGWLMSKVYKIPFDGRQKMKELLTHIPFLLPLKNLRNTYTLYSMNFGRAGFEAKNSKKVERIQQEAGLAGMYESFTEAGPQSIHQLVIIFSTGKISTAQKFSIPFSVFTLAWAASRAFFIQRSLKEADPNPEIGTVLRMVYPWMLLVVCHSVLMWTMIVGLLNKYAFLACLMSFLAILWSLSIVDWRMGKKQSPEIVLIIGQTYIVGQIYIGFGILAFFLGTQYSRETQGIVFASTAAAFATVFLAIKGISWCRNRSKNDPSCERGDAQTQTKKDSNDFDDSTDGKGETKEYFEVKSALTSVWLPCVVGSKSHIFVTSVMISQVNKLCLLAIAILLNYLEMIDVNVFLIWCRNYAKIQNMTDLTVCQQPYTSAYPEIAPCYDPSYTETSILQKVRICGPRESENLLRNVLIAITMLSTLLSAIASYKLAKIVDYFTLYKTSKRFLLSRLLCIKADPIVHHSLIFKLCISDENQHVLSEILAYRNAAYRSHLETVVNMTQQGETPLHMSTRFQAVQSSLLLLKAGGKLNENGDGQLPKILHLALEGNEPEIIEHILENQRHQPPFTISTLLQQKNLEGQTIFQVAASQKNTKLLSPLLKLVLPVINQQGSLIEETAELLRSTDCVEAFQELQNQQGLKKTTLKALMNKENADGLTCLQYAKETKTLNHNLKVLDIFLKHMKPFLSKPFNGDLCSRLFQIVAEVNKKDKSKQTILNAARQSSNLLRALEQLQKENDEDERLHFSFHNIDMTKANH